MGGNFQDDGPSVMSSASMNGALSDEGSSAMSWKNDTPPQVFHQVNQTFAEFAKPAKRPFAQAFANDGQVQYAREASGLLHSQPISSNITHRSSSLSEPLWQQQTREQPHPHAIHFNTTSNASPPSNPLRQQQNHGQEHPSHAFHFNNTYHPSSLSNPLRRQQNHGQVYPSNSRSYLSRVCGSIGSIFANVATHPISRTPWRAVHRAVRWAASKNRHTTSTYMAIVQLADSAKRRIVDHEVEQRDVQLERYRARVASQRQNEENHLRIMRIAERWSQNLPPVYEPFVMSGALMDTEENSPSTPTRTQRMPGSWEDSPVNDATTYYNRATPSMVTPITNRDLNVYDHVVDAMDTERAEPSQAAPVNNAWPYFGNEYHQVELRSMEIDDGDSSMISGDVLDQDSFTDSSDSTDSEETSSTNNSPSTEDHNMLSDEPVENEPVETESNTSDEDSYEAIDSVPVPVISTTPLDPLAVRYSWDNRDPDPIQRAAADEFNAILEDVTMMSDDLVDHDNPNTPSSSFPSTLNEAPIDPATPVKSTGLDKSVGSEASLSSSSVISNGIESHQGTGSPHLVSLSQDSPAVLDQGTPGQGTPTPLQQSSVVYQAPPFAHMLPAPLRVAIEGSPQKRVTFYESPRTGQPVKTIQHYVKGESMNYSDNSVTTDEDSSILSELTSTPEIHSSPCYQELVEQQLIIEQDDQQFLQSLAPPSPKIAPVDAVPATPAAPATPASLSRNRRSIKNRRRCQRSNKQRLAAKARGSPVRFSMRLRSAGPESDAASSVGNVEKQIPSTPMHIGSSIPVTSTLAQGGMAHETSHKTSSPSNQATTTIESPSRVSLAHGEESSSANDLSSLAQDGASNAPVTSSPTSGDGRSMDASNSFSSEPSPLNQSSSLLPSHSASPEIASQIASTGDASDEDALDNGTVDTPMKEAVSPSTQATTSAVATTPQSSLAEGTLVDGPSSSLTENDSRPSNQVDASAVATNSQSSLAEGTLVDGPSTSLTENDCPPSNRVDASTSDLSPASLARKLNEINIAGRRNTDSRSTQVRKVSDRQAAQQAKRLAAQRQKEKEEAEEKARKAKEAAEERKKRGTLRVPVPKVIQPLPAEWDAKVDATMRDPLMSKKIVLSLSGTEVTRRDLGMVLPQRGFPNEDMSGWLNDTIITAYLELVVDYALKASGHKRGEIPPMVALSSFFYPKLAGGAAGTDRWLKRSKIEGKKMKDVERIFIPINRNHNHWTLLVISPKFKTIEYFDSMHGPSAEILRNAKELVKHNLQEEYVEREWKIVNVRGPTQLNGSDCGVFVSTTSKMISLGVDPMAYDGNDTPVQRRRIVAELMNQGFKDELAPVVVFGVD